MAFVNGHKLIYSLARTPQFEGGSTLGYRTNATRPNTLPFPVETDSGSLIVKQDPGASGSVSGSFVLKGIMYAPGVAYDPLNPPHISQAQLANLTPDLTVSFSKPWSSSTFNTAQKNPVTHRYDQSDLEIDRNLEYYPRRVNYTETLRQFEGQTEIHRSTSTHLVSVGPGNTYSSWIHSNLFPETTESSFNLEITTIISLNGGWAIFAQVVGGELIVSYEPAFRITCTRFIKDDLAKGDDFSGSYSSIGRAASTGYDWDSSRYSLRPSDGAPANYDIGPGLYEAARAPFKDIPILTMGVGTGEYNFAASSIKGNGDGSITRFDYTERSLILARQVTDKSRYWDGARPLAEPDLNAPNDLMSEDNKRILASTNPIIYFGKHGQLCNPLYKTDYLPPENAKTGTIYSMTNLWFGLAWPLGWYVADAAIIGMFDEATQTMVDKTVAAVIYPAPANARNDVDDYLLIVSIDGAPIMDGASIKTWSVFDFFPGSVVTDSDTGAVTARELYFLDGRRWPDVQRVNVKPHYNFLHPAWPLRDTLWLEPFAMRLRDPKNDKFGPADCLFTLFLDTVYVQH
jgi:hypothetical protein